MSDIKRGTNVAGTVPATGPAAIRTTALLPGNRTSNMTTGTGPGSGNNRTGVGGSTGTSNAHRIANSHLSNDSSQSAVPQGTIRLDPSRHSELINASTSIPSTSSTQSLKTVVSTIEQTTGSFTSRTLENNVGHEHQVNSSESPMDTVTQNSVITNEPHLNETQAFENLSEMRDGPNRKRLRLDVTAANAERNSSECHSTFVRRHRLSGESLLDRRKRIQEHRKSRLQRLNKHYSQNATEHYFIQNHVPPGSFVDLQAFRKKPNLPFLNYLKTNRAPSQFLQEVALAVLGHSNSSELTDDHTRSNVASSAGKTSYENHSTSFMNNSNIQTLTVKRPSSKPSFHQNSSDDVEKAAPFSPLSHCGRITSAAMAHAIYMARKNKINQSSQALHPFLDLEYQTSTHLNDVNEIDVSQASLPTPKPSKFPPYSPKIVSGSELGGVMYGPKLGSFPPSLSSNTTLTLPTVPIPPTFSELQVRRKIKNWYMDSKIQIEFRLYFK